mmetsp:Transcript_8685/g.22341  ORF Transcript_8685/g.22341 Transcript_8685/m.22341 type:complete len:251 (+) Transcript_8685:609-1361(+)
MSTVFICCSSFQYRLPIRSSSPANCFTCSDSLAVPVSWLNRSERDATPTRRFSASTMGTRCTPFCSITTAQSSAVAELGTVMGGEDMWSSTRCFSDPCRFFICMTSLRVRTPTTWLPSETTGMPERVEKRSTMSLMESAGPHATVSAFMTSCTEHVLDTFHSSSGTAPEENLSSTEPWSSEARASELRRSSSYMLPASACRSCASEAARSGTCSGAPLAEAAEVAELLPRVRPLDSRRRRPAGSAPRARR